MQAQSKPILIKDLVMPYNGRTLNIRMERGLNYIKGNNGAGKTILLDYISGIRKSNLCIRGNENVLYINQSIFFSDRLLCKDFLKFIYRMDGNKNTNELKKFAGEFCTKRFTEKVLPELLKKQWGMLSGGERRFMYVFILLSLERDWYILDEPFVFLDDEKKNIVWKIIKRKVREGKGIILTSHEKELENDSISVNVIDLN